MARHSRTTLILWVAVSSLKLFSRQEAALRCSAFQPLSPFGSRRSRRSGLPSRMAPRVEMSLPVVDSILSPMSGAAGDAVSSAASRTLGAVGSLSDAVTGAAAAVAVPEAKIVGLVEMLGNLMGTLDALASASEYFGPVYLELRDQLSPLVDDVPAPIILGVSAFVTFAAISTLLNIGKPPPPSSPYPLGKYDAASARAYFDNRPWEVLARSVQITFVSASFGAALLMDYLRNNMEENADERAMELSQLLTVLGPSFIKIGQSLSIRTDLLSPAYQRGLKSLQDQVPPFDTSVARRMIEEELGLPVTEIFDEFSAEPVAAASLGQVYRATLRSNGTDVAVKVQRPNIMNQIALDMYIIREVAPFLKRTFNINTDLVGVVDVWAVGFVDELDYCQEADNAKIFTESMTITPLADVVFAPNVVDEYTSGMVLVTEWVDGERLDKSAKDDVTVLCSIAMNTYLTMMLETGVLHCDPHPGNLLRTPDGKLCILDWGMVTRLSPNLQATLIEHMAHLTSADYGEIPKDLLELGFIPQNKAALIKDSGVVETLADIYGAWTMGGGAAKIDVNKVVTQLQDLTAEKGNLFQIPAYFAYIAKSFSVLEGIGLSNDPSYSIINECLPYVSKRLLTDANPRTGGALNTFLFGPSKSNADRILDYDRVEQLITGFGDYSTSASGDLLNRGPISKSEMAERQADEILDLLLTEDDTPLQSIFLEQLAKIIASSSRSVWGSLREASGTLPGGRSLLGTLVDPLGLWRTSPLVRVSDLDQRTIETTRSLIALLQEESKKTPIYDVATLSNEEIIEISSALTRKLWEKRYGLVKTGGKLARVLLQLTADKLETGEREVMVLPRTTPVNDGRIHTDTQPATSDQTVDLTTRNAAEPPSKRLQEARRLLSGLEQMEESSAASSSINAPTFEVEVEVDNVMVE